MVEEATQEARAVFNDALIASIGRILQPGGELHVASDVEEYFDLIRELITANPHFRQRPAPEAGAPEHDLDYLTNFERKYRLEGRPIHRASYSSDRVWPSSLRRPSADGFRLGLSRLRCGLTEPTISSDCPPADG